jgi:hypothetical protein
MMDIHEKCSASIMSIEITNARTAPSTNSNAVSIQDYPVEKNMRMTVAELQQRTNSSK